MLDRIAFIRNAQRVGLSLGEIVDALAGLPIDRAPSRKDRQRLTGRWRERIDQHIAVLEAPCNGLGAFVGSGCLSLLRPVHSWGSFILIRFGLARPDDVGHGYP